MSIWKKFIETINTSSDEKFTSRLHERTSNLFPDRDEAFHLKAACLSGLMARVAYADLNISGDEKVVIKASLIKWLKMSAEEAGKLAELCTDDVKDLAGIENHLYCLPLRESLPTEERYQILETLFAIAAADQNVENQENEEIRNIGKGLLLEHHHFIGARASVLEFLATLKA